MNRKHALSASGTRMLAGQALLEPLIISGHTHIGDGWNHPVYVSDDVSILKTMDAVGINISCISSMRALGPDLGGGNAEVASYVKRHPDRFVGTVVANPHYPAQTQSDLDRLFGDVGFGMIKVHPEFHAYPLDGPRYANVWALANERRIPVLTHTWGFGRGLDHPALAIPVVEKYPDVPLVLGHAGGTPDGLRASVDVAHKYPNVYLDTATSLVYRGAIEYLVASVGYDRVIFGTDAAYLSDSPQVGKVAGSDLSEDVIRAILGLNLQRLLSAADVNLPIVSSQK